METSKYKQLVRQLQRDIESGVYPHGSRLPSENELAEQYQICRQTVRQATTQLQQEGLVERRQGSGTYVSAVAGKRLRSMNIAIVTTYIDEYIFPSILRGIEMELSKNGYSPILMPTHNRLEEERRVLQSCFSKAIDGLIVEGTKTALPNPNIDLYKKLASKGLPIVFLNGYYADLEKPVYVVADDRDGGRQATEHLLRKGHRRLAGIFKSDDIQGHRRYSGFVNSLIANGLPLEDECVFWFTTETRESVFSANMLRILLNCTGVVCYNDETAIRLESMLRKKGVRVPEQLAIVSFDDSVYSEMAAVKLTSLAHPKESAGIQAVRKLLNLIAGRPETPSVLPWKLMEKESG